MSRLLSALIISRLKRDVKLKNNYFSETLEIFSLLGYNTSEKRERVIKMEYKDALNAEKLRKIFSRNLNRLLQNSGHNKIELAKYMGVSTSTVSDWCNGNKYPRMDKVEKIAAWFGVLKSQLTEDSARRIVEIPEGFEPVPSYHMVPVVGDIACGTPILAEENIDGYEPCPDFVHADFCLRCHGDSMVGAEIHDGDVVFIKKQPTVENGQIAAVQVDDGDCYNATLKRFYRSGDTVTLMSENPSVAPMVFNDDQINRIHIAGRAVYCLSAIK